MTERQFRQRLPRPTRHELGDVAPWLAASGPVPDISIADVIDVFSDWQSPPAPSIAARAAVLIPLFEHEGLVHVVLIRRAAGLGRDPGHIAFPGGHIDAGETPRDAALREADEEVGIAPSSVRVLGELPMAHRVADGQRVAPFVGLLAQPPTLHPNLDEVELAFSVPLGALLVDGVAWQERRYHADDPHPVRLFADLQLLGDDVIWGLTAQILWQLLEHLTATR